MFEDCTYWISRLQPRKRGLTPEECFHLWSHLGELRFHLWVKTLPADETGRVIEKAQNLQQQLSEAVVRYTSPHAHTSILLVRLEAEMVKVIKEIQAHIKEAKQLLKKHDLTDSWDQTEFDMYIQTPMDRIGYTLQLLKTMKLSLSPDLFQALGLLDIDMKEMFPQAAKQYRESGNYPIDAGRLVFPEFFWWRQDSQLAVRLWEELVHSLATGER